MFGEDKGIASYRKGECKMNKVSETSEGAEAQGLRFCGTKGNGTYVEGYVPKLEDISKDFQLILTKPAASHLPRTSSRNLS